ncbi:hypothetical protein [Lysinibacillus fusiformis]|uniref:hypothetical protein n=1 Tax=Lysinibacillus fusiformis TaxID=28031 RepID=UPI0036E01CCF
MGLGIMITGVIMVILAVDLSEGGIIFTVISQLFTGFGIGLAQPTTGAIAFNTLNQVKREKYPPVPCLLMPLVRV